MKNLKLKSIVSINYVGIKQNELNEMYNKYCNDRELPSDNITFYSDNMFHLALGTFDKDIMSDIDGFIISLNNFVKETYPECEIVLESIIYDLNKDYTYEDKDNLSMTFIIPIVDFDFLYDYISTKDNMKIKLYILGGSGLCNVVIFTSINQLDFTFNLYNHCVSYEVELNTLLDKTRDYQDGFSLASLTLKK